MTRGRMYGGERGDRGPRPGRRRAELAGGPLGGSLPDGIGRYGHAPHEDAAHLAELGRYGAVGPVRRRIRSPGSSGRGSRGRR
ncbi:hypothetical protein GCM10010129_77560 [Streptomyces fumigatiscleroticus]|nr:hypothetical protein GCM10010129_77560 [Streptomyces fumigatiscleroticus]